MNQSFTNPSGYEIKRVIILFFLLLANPWDIVTNQALAHGSSAIQDTLNSTTNKPELDFKLGPPVELKWDEGPISLGMVMDLALVSLSSKTSQDLMISRIWDGMHVFPSGDFSADDLLKPSIFAGSAGILLFQAVDWNKDGVTDLIAANRNGFLYLVPGKGNFPDVQYDVSTSSVMRDVSTGLPFNIPYENPNYPKQDDLGGYIDVQYYNYCYPKMYTTTASPFKDLIIGDWAGNLWWLQDQSDGKGEPFYKGIKYTKEESNQKAGVQFQRDYGLDYVKPADKISDESGQPFLLGVGKAETLTFQGANTRPIVYPDESGMPGLLVVTGSYKQQVFYLKRVNPLHERKPIFKNMGEVHIDGLDQSKMTFHAMISLFENKGRNDLLLATDNYLGVIENTGWENGRPYFKFRNWMSGKDARGSFYAFNDMLTDDKGRRFIIHFAEESWNFIPVEKVGDGLRLHYTDSLQLMDQNGVFHVDGETDPQLSPQWGYHRIAHWDFDNSGRNHLIVGTDKGHFYLLKDDPALAKPGKFIFRSSGPLKDSSGDVIRIHSRAVAAGIDLNEDGLEDLLVGGISYQLGIKSDPSPGGGIYYLINMGNDAEGLPILSTPQALDLGPDFKPRMNSHISLQVLDIDNDGEKEIIIGLQDAGWDGRIFRKLKGKVGLYDTGSRVSAKPIKDQILDIDGDGIYELVKAGDETGVGYYRKLEKQ